MINVAFCFDDNLINQVKVAILSLLETNYDIREEFDIYCLYVGKAIDYDNYYTDFVSRHGYENEVHLLRIVDNPFDESYEVRGITGATYLRLLMPNILKNVDKLLYFDVDVLFCDSIKELWDYDITDKLIAGVKGSVNMPVSWLENSKREYWHRLDGCRGKYVNAGVLIMNLKEMRKVNIQKEWEAFSKLQFYYQDQDILNISCMNRVGFLSPKYNFQACVIEDEYRKYVDEGIFEKAELEAAISKPAIIHYSGDKPWNNYYTNLASEWWQFVETDFELKKVFNKFKLKYVISPVRISCRLLVRSVQKIVRMIKE